MFIETIEKTKLLLTNASWPFELSGEFITFALLLCFAGLSNLEARFPKITRPTAQTHESYRTNIGLFVFNSLVLSACSVSSLYLIAGRHSGFGLLNTVPDITVKAVLSFLAFDLLLYGWHRLCHTSNLLWLFHRVHHNDPNLNVSTAFRLHFVEVLLTNCLKALLIVLLGIDKTLVLAIEAITTVCIMFHHTNTSFKHESIIGYGLIVPRLHRVHHSVERREHDNNYGAVLSLWDRLFGTLLDAEPKKIGINGESPLGVLGLIRFGLGFEMPAPTHPCNLDVMIAEAAYYKAERRNFRPGNELRDWLDAKTEIMHQLSAKRRNKKLEQTNWWYNFLPQF